MDGDNRLWLTELVLGAASAPDLGPKFIGNITSPTGVVYRLGEQLASSKRFNLYPCFLPLDKLGAPQQMGLLKIAADVAMNGAFESEARILLGLRTKSDYIEATLAPGESPYNYHYFFPEVAETFIGSEAQGGRRITILRLAETVESPQRLTPVTTLVSKEKVRVDPKTVTWIFGKTMKVLAFAHGQKIAVNAVNGNNILIERDIHGVIIFDWSMARRYSERVPFDILQEEVAQAARMAIALMGGDPDRVTIPDYPDQLDSDQRLRFLTFFQRLISGGAISAYREHETFYKMISEFWGRKFHVFTAYPL